MRVPHACRAAVSAAFLGVAGTAITLSAPATDTHAKVKLTYQVAEGLQEKCPDKPGLQNEVSSRLGYDPFDDQADLVMRVDVRRIGDRVEADVEKLAPDGKVAGRRRLEAAHDCRELVHSAALAIAMAVDARRAQGAQEPAASFVPSAVPIVDAGPPPTVADSARAPQHDAPRTPPARWRLAAGPIGATGSSPGFALGLASHVALKWPSFSMGLEARADPMAESIRNGAKRGSTALLLGTVLPCVHVEPWMGCGLLSFGVLQTRGEGFSNSQQANLLFSAVGVRAGAAVKLDGRFFVNPYGDIRAALSRITLQMNGRDVWSNPTLSLAFGVNLGMDL